VGIGSSNEADSDSASDTETSSSLTVDDDALSWGPDAAFWGTRNVAIASTVQDWPFIHADDEENPTEWTVTWHLGSHSFTIDEDMVFDVHDPKNKISDPDLRTIPELYFDREGTPASDIDLESINIDLETGVLLDPSHREKMDVEHDRGSKTSYKDWLGLGLGFPDTVSVMDRGRPVRKSSAACWPGVGRTYPSEPLEEWRPRKDY